MPYNLCVWCEPAGEEESVIFYSLKVRYVTAWQTAVHERCSVCASSPTSHIHNFILRQFYAEMCHISGLMNALVPPISEHSEAAMAQEVIAPNCMCEWLKDFTCVALFIQTKCNTKKGNRTHACASCCWWWLGLKRREWCTPSLQQGWLLWTILSL